MSVCRSKVKKPTRSYKKCILPFRFKLIIIIDSGSPRLAQEASCRNISMTSLCCVKRVLLMKIYFGAVFI